jgi:anaerobic sulfite reductase subunit C
MIWSEEAEKAVGRVPFFVRGKVRAHVEREAVRRGAGRVGVEHVDACRKRFLSGKGMEEEIKGYQIETCFGTGGCENRTVESAHLIAEMERILSRRDFPSFLRERVGGRLKFHHELRVSVSDCPNACSRPQIADIGIMGARRPQLSDEPCTGCGACEKICLEHAVRGGDGNGRVPAFDAKSCVGCGKCLDACPSGALGEGARGYRILVGGKLGRHPRLGIELDGIHCAEEAVKIVERCLELYFRHNISGERFGAILGRIGIEALCKL